MSLPSDTQLNQEKSFLLAKQPDVYKIISATLKHFKENVDIPQNKTKRFKSAAKNIKALFTLLKKSKAPKNWSQKKELNNLIEGLNTLIADIQTICFSKSPKKELHLSFLTRIGEQYVRNNQDYLKTITALYLNAGNRDTKPCDLNNKIFKLPENMNMLSSVEIFYARYNCLSSLPDALWQLPKLRELGLEGNCLKSISGNIQKLTTLEELGLDRNKITALPAQIGKLPKLKILSLDGNLLLELPKSINQLTTLRILGLNNNFLFDLPDISTLPNLEIVGARNNLLIKYPSLKSPKTVVDVSRNGLTPHKQEKRPR
ncbi:MAG: leucine-rich repeat domain-containing protein [Candidatus Berkiella sp.]